MTRSVLVLLVGSSLALGGCVASMAAGVVGAAVRAASSGRQEPEVDLRAAARLACAERAAQYGSVHVIDAEQGRGRRATVWGTVQDPHQRRSFECSYNNGGISSFTLRPIAQRPGTTP